MPDNKKFLDYEGLIYLASKLNEYPNNTVLTAVINAIESEINDTKTDLDVSFTVDEANELLILKKGE